MSENNAFVDGFALNIPEDTSNTKLSIAWLLLAVGSMVIAGLFTILVVLSRVPYTKEFFPWVDFFHTALVVHVDLTVLTWFLSFAGLFWSLNSTKRCSSCGWVAFWLALIGTLVIIVSPFLGAGKPFLNNYVPVLQDPIFYTGLAIFGLGFSVLVIRGLFASRPVGASISGGGAIRFGLYTALIAALVSILALLVSWKGIPDNAEGEYFFELLFWGAGHTLQFVHVQLAIVVWLCLATISGVNLKITPRIVLFIFALGLIPVLLTPVVYLAFDVSSGDHLQAITWLMQYGGGMAALPVGLAIVYSMATNANGFPKASGERNALIFSFVLFGAGGIIGFMISGSNTIVPAHYHGSITAITLAFMGITYHLLPRLGFRKPVGKWVTWQPVIYATGQILHISGLAWSGGHGVQRKTAGAAQGLDTLEKVIGMRVMGAGGGIAIIGGIIFLVIVFKSISAAKTSR
jgi:cytochrome c oxidase subunit I